MYDHFTKENRWLSNFWPAKAWYEGVCFPTTENAYQAAKVADPDVRKGFVGIKASEAKKKGGEIEMRPDFENVKLEIMEELNRQKFTYSAELKAKLLATGNQDLIEGNWWGDQFWGVCSGKGQNNLGKILMKIRKELQEKA